MEKSGSWFSYKGERVGQGRENAKQFLKDNKDIVARIEVDVRKSLGLISSADKAQAAQPPTLKPRRLRNRSRPRRRKISNSSRLLH